MNSPTRSAPAGFLKLSSEVAAFYGFKALRAANFTAAASSLSAQVNNRSTEPLLAYYATPSPSHVPLGQVSKELAEFGMQVVGTPESVGEVVLLKTMSTIINEWGGKVARVRVNALGDKDSKMRFARELSLYLRKHAPELDADCRQLLGDDPLAAFACQSLVSKEVIEGGPRAMNFLSEKSRAHFREVLEHLENLQLPYELDDMLVGDDREPRIIFAIDLEDEDATIVSSIGGRFDDYLRKVTGRKDGTAVSASIFFRKKGLETKNFTLPKAKGLPKIFFVQLGLRAKLQGLAVMESLRRARVPVLQTFNAAQLGPQLLAARAAGVTHLIIMGQREALDGTVLVRAMNNSSQEIVSLAALPRFVKNL